MTPRPERHVPLPLLGLGGVLLLDGSAGLLTAVFREVLPTPLGLAPVLACFVALAFFAGHLRIAEVRRTAFTLALLGIGGAAMAAGYSARYLRLRAAISGAPVVSAVSVSAAPQHGEARLLSFTDGKLLPGCLGRHSEQVRDHHHDYYALPIVPAGWKRSDPVPAWAGFVIGDTLGDKSYSESVAELKRPHGGGLVWRGEYTVTRLQRAVAEASGKCGLTAAKGAPILEWMDPSGELSGRAREAAGALGLLNGLWLLRLLLLLLGWPKRAGT